MQLDSGASHLYAYSDMGKNWLTRVVETCHNNWSRKWNRNRSGGGIRSEFYMCGFPGTWTLFCDQKQTNYWAIEWMGQLLPITKSFEAICVKIEEKPSKAESLLVSQLQKQFPMVFKEELGHCVVTRN